MIFGRWNSFIKFLGSILSHISHWSLIVKDWRGLLFQTHQDTLTLTVLSHISYGLTFLLGGAIVEVEFGVSLEISDLNHEE